MRKSEVAQTLIQAEKKNGEIIIRNLPDKVQVYIFRYAKKTQQSATNSIQEIMAEYRQTIQDKGGDPDAISLPRYVQKTNVLNGFVKNYGKAKAEEVKKAIKACEVDGKVYGMHLIYPELYALVRSYAFYRDIPSDQLLIELYEKYIEIDNTCYFANKKQEQVFIKKYYGKNLTRMREDPVAFYSLWLMAQKEGCSVYAYMKKNGYEYSPIAKNLDYLDLLQKRIKKRSALSEYQAVPQELQQQIQTLLEKVVLTKPNLQNELLSDEEILSELGLTQNGNPAKPIYTDARCLKLYAEFLKRMPKANIYDNLSVAYAITKLAKIRKVQPTILAKYLNDKIESIVQPKGLEKYFTPSLSLNIAQHANSILIMDDNETNTQKERKNKKILDNPKETVYTTERK